MDFEVATRHNRREEKSRTAWKDKTWLSVDDLKSTQDTTVLEKGLSIHLCTPTTVLMMMHYYDIKA